MDWVTLLLLVPLVVIPIVFLSGFAGCGFTGLVCIPPQGLVATAVGPDRIELEWTFDASDIGSFPVFRIQRSENGGQTIFLPLSIPITPGGVQIHHHTDMMDLKAATTYEYEVFFFAADDECSGVSSDIARETTLFAAFDDNQENWADNCMVQRINANLFNSGTKVIITLRGSTTNALMIKRAYISQAAPAGGPGGEVWDSLAGNLTQVKFGGNDGVLLMPLLPEAPSPYVSDEIAYTLDPTKDLIIAFDIGDQGGARRGPKVGCQAYRSAINDQAATADRSNFTNQGPPTDPAEGQPSNTAYLVEKIEVFS